MRCVEAMPIYDDLFSASGFDIADPVAILPKAIHHDGLGTLFPVFNYLENSLTPQTATPANVIQQQEAMAQQPSQMPAVEINRSAKQVPQECGFS